MPSRNPPVSYPDTLLVTQGEIFIAFVICYSNIQNIQVTQVTRDGDSDLLRAMGNNSGQDSEPQEASPSDLRVNSWTALDLRGAVVLIPQDHPILIHPFHQQACTRGRARLVFWHYTYAGVFGVPVTDKDGGTG